VSTVPLRELHDKACCTRHKLDLLSFGISCKNLAYAVVYDLSVVAISVHPADMAVFNMLVWLCIAAECSVMMHLFALLYGQQQSFDTEGTAGQVCPPAEHQGWLALAAL